MTTQGVHEKIKLSKEDFELLEKGITLYADGELFGKKIEIVYETWVLKDMQLIPIQVTKKDHIRQKQLISICENILMLPCLQI